MSTKTIYKRIALVAVTALGAGVLSVAPASAGVITTAAGGTVVTSISTPVRTSATTWTANVVLSQTTAATPAAGDTYASTVVVTDPATAGAPATAAIPTYTLTAADLFSANVSKFTVVMTITAASASIADVLDAASTVAVTLTVGGVAAAAATTITAPPLSTTGIFVAGTAFSQTSGSALTQIVNGQGTLNFVGGTADSSYTVTTSGVGTILSATASTAPVLIGTVPSGGFTWTPVTNRQTLSVLTTSTTAGVQTITYQPIGANGVPGTAITATVTYTATPVPSVGTTTSIVNATTGTTDATDATILVSKSTTGQVANIVVTIKDQAGNALNNQTVSATISGPGLITAASGTAGGAGTARVASVTITNNTAVAAIGVNSDGTSGVGTITITVGTTVVATETVGFFDVPATVTAVQNHSVLSTAGGAAGIAPATNAGTGADIANTPSVILTVRDKNGLPVTNLTAASTSVSAISSDTTVMSETIGMSVNLGTGAANTAVGTYNVRVSSVAKASGSTATLKFKVMTGTTTFIESAPLTYKLGGAVASVALSMNKTSYTPGEAAVVTLTVKDAAGNAAFDGDHANITAAALSSSLGITGSLVFGANGTTVSSLGGVAVAKVNAPGTSGTWTVSGTTGTGPSTAAEKGKALTASAAVTSSVDISALTTLVNSLIAKINALNKLVIKIQKKVRA